MNTLLNTELNILESRLEKEIFSIQDEIEMLLELLDRKQKTLDDIRQQIAELNPRGYEAA